MMMTNNSGKIRILRVVFLSLLLIFELIQQVALVNLMSFLNILKILIISFWTFWRKNCISLGLWASFSWKSCKAFRIALCKQPRLVKPCLNSDLYFLSKTSNYKKSNKKVVRLCIKFSPTSNISVQRCLHLLFKNQCPHFLLSPLFRKLCQPSGQNKQSGQKW